MAKYLDKISFSIFMKVLVLAKKLSRVPIAVTIIVFILLFPLMMVVLLFSSSLTLIGRMVIWVGRAIYRSVTYGKLRTGRITGVVLAFLAWVLVFAFAFMIILSLSWMIISVLPSTKWLFGIVSVISVGTKGILLAEMRKNKSFESPVEFYKREKSKFNSKIKTYSKGEAVLFRYLWPGSSHKSLWTAAFIFTEAIFSVTVFTHCLDLIFPGVFFTSIGDHYSIFAWLNLHLDQVLRIIPVDFMAPFIPTLRPLIPIVTSPWGEFLMVLEQVVLLGSATISIILVYWHYRARIEDDRTLYGLSDSSAALEVIRGIETKIDENENGTTSGTAEKRIISELIREAGSREDAGEYRIGMALLNRAVEIARLNHLDDELITSLSTMAKMADAAGNREQSFEHLNAILAATTEPSRWSARCEALVCMANLYSISGDKDSALECSIKAVWEARIHGDGDDWLKTTLLQQSTLLITREDHEGVLRIASECRQLLNNKESRKEYNQIYQLQALALMEENRYREAIICLLEQEELLVDGDLLESLAGCLMQQVICYMELKDIETGLQIARRSLEVAINTNSDLVEQIEAMITIMELQ